MIALADINCFYVSAELLFKPWLRDRPICVASSNDGSVVSRNDQAKKLGISMSQPVFELRELIEREGLIVFSSNYELYQSLSNRFLAILTELAPVSIPYSIDETMCMLDGVDNPESWARHAQSEIMRRIGLPIGVGVAPTATLAKLASWAAKRFKAKTGGVLYLGDPVRQEKLLRYAKASDVWGIGPRLSERLSNELGIQTAWQLACADPKLLRRQFSVNVERTARELLGVRCVVLDEGGAKKQTIICSRSFGSRITTLPALKEAVAGFVTTAALKLRSQGSFANCIQVFARTSPFAAGAQYGASRIISLPFPTHDTRDLLQAALEGLVDLYRQGPEYAKAGVVLSQFEQREGMTSDLFAPPPRKNSDALMAVVDAINAKQGRGAVRLGRDTSVGKWQMRRDHLTPAYTTSWHGLPKVRS
jgi:DNA polymerase V